MRGDATGSRLESSVAPSGLEPSMMVPTTPTMLFQIIVCFLGGENDVNGGPVIAQFVILLVVTLLV